MVELERGQCLESGLVLELGMGTLEGNILGFKLRSGTGLATKKRAFTNILASIKSNAESREGWEWITTTGT